MLISLPGAASPLATVPNVAGTKPRTQKHGKNRILLRALLLSLAIRLETAPVGLQGHCQSLCIMVSLP